jgi:hypothetical protein
MEHRQLSKLVWNSSDEATPPLYSDDSKKRKKIA